MNTELENIQTALATFDKTEAGLQALRDQFTGVLFPVHTPLGLKEAIAARRAIREPRVATEAVRKEAKAPLLSLGRQLDAKAKYITEELLKLEGPIDAQIKTEEARKALEIENENKRIIGIKERINDLGLLVPKMAGQTSAELQKQIDILLEHDLTEWAMEFIAEAEKAREQTVQALQRLHAGALAQEKSAAEEAARREAERAELEALRAAEAKRQAEERERQERIAAEEQAARDRIAAQERESARLLEEARKAEEAANAALREAQEAVERAEAEKARKAREAEQAKRDEAARLKAEKEREKQRRAAERADATRLLELFMKHPGSVDPEFSDVRSAISIWRKARAAEAA